jgi:bifunctional pyridoxal-dependent enzyme with beta-cystathionase and maltose regulon repressor activities
VVFLDTPPQERAPIGEIDLVLEKICALLGEWFGKQVCKLIIRVNMANSKRILLKKVPNKV